MNRLLVLFFSLMVVLQCANCDEPREGINEATVVRRDTSTAALVTVTTATTGQLPLRRRTNGKLRARREVLVNGQTSGILTEAPVEGTYYKAGATLAATDPRPLELARNRAAAARDEAAFQHRDLLLRHSMNLPPGDSSVSTAANENLLIQSGLPTAEVVLREAEFALQQATQTAPFAGRAADVKVQAGQFINRGEAICTLIDPTSLEAEFNLLEQEIASLGGRRTIYVSPLAQPDRQLSATLDIINPRVDESGLLRVRARLGDTGGTRLYPGMNVEVTLEATSEPAVLVPKQAIVLRSGKPLVFTYDADTRRAKWQYVTIGQENDEQVALSDGVEPGQQVIVGGNLNLDHDSQVRLELD